MQLTLRYPIYQILAILMSTLTVLHVGVPIFAPPVHAYDLSSLLLWVGSIPSFVIIIWAYCREIDDLFLGLKSDDYSSTKRVRSSLDTAAEDTRFKALFIMTSASAATLTTDLLQLWWVAVRGAVGIILPISADPANRLWELFWGFLFLIMTIAATGFCGLGVWIFWNAPFGYLRGLGIEANVNWWLCRRVKEESPVEVELVDTMDRPATY